MLPIEALQLGSKYGIKWPTSLKVDQDQGDLNLEKSYDQWYNVGNTSLVPRLPREMGNESGRFVHLPHDVACVIFCIINSLAMQSVLVLICRSQQHPELRLGTAMFCPLSHCKSSHQEHWKEMIKCRSKMLIPVANSSACSTDPLMANSTVQWRAQLLGLSYQWNSISLCDCSTKILLLFMVIFSATFPVTIKSLKLP